MAARRKRELREGISMAFDLVRKEPELQEKLLDPLAT
jgi:hypothetical protein